MSEYNENALYYHEQVVILDTTNAGSTSGGLIVKGGISGKDTYITGHVAVNNVKITPNKNDIIFEQQAILDRSETFTNITDFYFDDSIANSFKAIINVTVSGGTSKYALWEINGVYKPTGWVITSTFTGDQTGVNFKIVNSSGRGQIQYTNLNDAGTTTTIRYRANTTAPPGSTPLGEGSGYINNTSGPYIANRLLYSNSADTIANTDLVYASNVFTIGGTSRILAQSSSSFTNFSNGGAITSMGDASVAKKMIVGEKVGIVTTSPQFNLDVSGDINFTGNFYKNGSLYSGSSIWDTNANNEIFTTQNLGIGTSDPTYKLDVSGGIRVTDAITAGALHVTNELATNISSATLNLSSGLTSGSAKVTDITNTNASIGTLNVTGLTAGNINFTGTLYENGTPYVNSQWTTGTVGNLTYTGGNVGINTTSPQATLDVLGSAKVQSLSTGNLNASGATVLANVTTGTVTATTINSSLVSANTITGGNLSLSGDLFVAGSLTAVNITTTNLMDTNITAGVAKITDANITTATVATLLNTNSVSTNVSSATLTLSTGLTSGSAQITNQSSTNISSGTLNVSTGLTSASLQATNANVTTATVATLLTTNQNSTNVSAATLTLSTGLTSASAQVTNANVTTATVATLLNTNAVSTNVSSATLNLSSGLTAASAQITNHNSTNISSATLNLSTGLTSASLQATNANVTTATIPTLLNTNVVSTNVSSATLTLSTGLTTASAQITNENVTTSTIATARITTSLLAIGNSNTIGNIFTTGGNVGIGVVNPSLALEVSGRSIMKNAGIGTSGAVFLDDTNKGIQYSGNNGSVNSYFNAAGSFPNDGIAVFGWADGALGTKQGGNSVALAWNSSGNVGIGTNSPVNKLDVSGTARITTSLTTGAVYTTNVTSTNVVATNSSLGTINALGATMGGSVVPSANITYDLGSSSLRWKDLYLSGNTIHLGEKQLSLLGDAFTVDKINILSTGETISSTTGAFVVNGGVGISKSLNVNGTVSSSLVSSTAFTGSTLNLSTGLTASSAQITNSNVTTSTIATLRNTNAISTNISSATLNLSTGLTSASLQATNANVTTATVSTLLNTNAVSTNISSGTLNLSTGLTSASLQVTNENVTNSTIATLRNTNAISTNISVGTISATTITGSNISLSGNLSVAGTLTTVNITSTNLVNTNVSAGVVVASTLLSATGNSNTIGSIFTTGGNIGVGTVTPSVKLDVNGEISSSNYRLKNWNNSAMGINFVGTTTYYKIATLPTTADTNGSGGLSIKGMVGGWYTDQVGHIDLFIATRNGVFIRGDYYGGSVSLVAGYVDLQIRTEANNTYSVYLVCNSYFKFDLMVGGSGLQINLISPNMTGTTSPSGSVQTTSVVTALQMYNVAGNIGINNTSPSNTLDVSGTARITTSLTTGTINSTNLTSTNIFGTNVSAGTLNLSTGLTSPSAQITNENVTNSTIATLINTNAISTNISSGTLNLSTGLTSSSAQITNENVTTSTIATLRNTNAVSINISSGTLNLSTGITSSSAQITNENITNSTIVTLINTNAISTNISSGTLILSTGLTSSSAQITNENVTNSTIATLRNTNAVSTNISSGTLNLSTGLTSSSAQITNENVTNSTIATLRNTNAISTNISSGTLNLSTGLTSSSVQITTSLLATGNSNTIGSIFTTGGNVGIGTNVPANNLDVSGTARITTSLTTGGLFSTNLTSTNIVGTNISAGALALNNINVSSATISNLLNNSQTIVGTLGSFSNLPKLMMYGSGDTNNPLYYFSALNSENIGSGYGAYVSTSGIVRMSTTSTSWLIGKSTGSLNIIKCDGNGTVGSVANRDIRFMIETSGNVGIATTAPAYTLDVNGTCDVSISITTAALFSTNITSTNIVGTNITSTNMVGTNITSTNMVGTNITSTNMVGTNITSINMVGTNITSTNIAGTNITSTNVVATNLSAGGLALSNINISTATISNLLSNSQSIIGTLGSFSNLPRLMMYGSGDTNNPLYYFSALNSENIGSGYGAYVSTAGTIKMSTTSTSWLIGKSTGSLNIIKCDGTVGSTITTPDVRFMIEATGNVGIANTAPAYTLDVNGTFEASNSNGIMLFASSGNLGIGTTSPAADLHILESTANSSNPSNIFIDKNGERAAVQVWNYNNTKSNLQISSNMYWNNAGNGVLHTTAGGATAWSIVMGSNSDSFTLARYTDTNVGRDYFSMQSSGSTRLSVLPGVDQPNNIRISRNDGSFTGIRYHDLEFQTSVTQASSYMAIKLHNGTTTTSQAEVMRLRADGRVGIGTTSPQFKLDIDGTLNASHSNGVMLFASSGNVGIGTSSPSATLEVDGTVRIDGTGTGSNGSMLITGRDSFGHSLYIGGAAAQKRIGFQHLGTVGSIFAYDYGAGASQNLTLQGPGGSVGIGTTAPQATLHVASGQFQLGEATANGFHMLAINGGLNAYGGTWGAGVTRFCCDSRGNFGIGTLSPTSRLQVIGDFSIVGTIGSFVTMPKFTINDRSDLNNPLFGFTAYDKENIGFGLGVYVNTSGSVIMSTTSTSWKIGKSSGGLEFVKCDGNIGSSASQSMRMLISTNGNIGLGGGTNNAYLLTLASDSAAKPSTALWTISSDSRLKTNITQANLDTCYNTVKNIPLKRYTWLNEVYTLEQVQDRSKLGWIAQDVETLLPKSVEQRDMFGYSDCRTLNSDQIIASLYGAVQKLMEKVEQLESQLNNFT